MARMLRLEPAGRVDLEHQRARSLSRVGASDRLAQRIVHDRRDHARERGDHARDAWPSLPPRARATAAALRPRAARPRPRSCEQRKPTRLIAPTSLARATSRQRRAPRFGVLEPAAGVVDHHALAPPCTSPLARSCRRAASVAPPSGQAKQPSRPTARSWRRACPPRSPPPPCRRSRAPPSRIKVSANGDGTRRPLATVRASAHGSARCAPALERAHDRRAAARPAPRPAAACAPCVQPSSGISAKGARHAHQAGAAAGRIEDHVGQLPAELLRDLVAERLLALEPERLLERRDVPPLRRGRPLGERATGVGDGAGHEPHLGAERAQLEHERLGRVVGHGDAARAGPPRPRTPPPHCPRCPPRAARCPACPNATRAVDRQRETARLERLRRVAALLLEPQLGRRPARRARRGSGSSGVPPSPSRTAGNSGANGSIAR